MPVLRVGSFYLIERLGVIGRLEGVDGSTAILKDKEKLDEIVNHYQIHISELAPVDKDCKLAAWMKPSIKPMIVDYIDEQLYKEQKGSN